MIEISRFLRSVIVVWFLIPFKLFAQNQAQEVLAICQNDPGEQEAVQNELLQLQKQLQSLPRSPQIHYEMGLVYQQLNQIEQAKQSFYQALAWSDDSQFNSKVLYNVGNLNVCNQNLDEAIASYRNALKQNPDDFDTKYNLALAHFMKKQDQQQNQNNQQNQDNQNQQQDSKQDQQEDSQNSDNQQQQNQDNQNNQQDSQNSDNQDQQQQNQAQNSNQQQDSKQDQQEDSQDSESDSLQESGLSQETSDDEQTPFSLSKLQVEQALNAVQENRKGFVRRMLQQQLGNQAPPEKNW